MGFQSHQILTLEFGGLRLNILLNTVFANFIVKFSVSTLHKDDPGRFYAVQYVNILGSEIGRCPEIRYWNQIKRDKMGSLLKILENNRLITN